MKLKVEIERELSQEFISDIICTAFEGGINYWCNTADPTVVDKQYVSAVLYDAEDENKAHTLTSEAMVEAIKGIMEGTYQCRSDIREAITKGIIDLDGGYIDADGADVIVQFAVFKELVYG